MLDGEELEEEFDDGLLLDDVDWKAEESDDDELELLEGDELDEDWYAVESEEEDDDEFEDDELLELDDDELELSSPPPPV